MIVKFEIHEHDLPKNLEIHNIIDLTVNAHGCMEKSRVLLRRCIMSAVDNMENLSLIDKLHGGYKILSRNILDIKTKYYNIKYSISKLNGIISHSEKVRVNKYLRHMDKNINVKTEVLNKMINVLKQYRWDI